MQLITPEIPHQSSGAPNDSFLLLQYIENTFQDIQSTIRPLELHSKRRYKICICLVILGELKSFWNYKGFSVTFPKILDSI